jgi:hypothetical protein
MKIAILWSDDRGRVPGMPQVTYKIGFMGRESHEEEFSEYLCDWPGCSNVAEHVLGCAKEIGVSVALCEEHAARK